MHTYLRKGRYSLFIPTSLSVNKEPKLTLPLVIGKCYSRVSHKDQSYDHIYSIFISVMFFKTQKILALPDMQIIILPTHSPQK